MRTLALTLIAAATVASCTSKAVPPAKPAPDPDVGRLDQPKPDPTPVDPVSPLDPKIKRTTLANGLTIYVARHQKPEQRAALWLAVNAGAVLEDDDQRGLAHYVEHMAFNGTKRFPKQEIINFIEKSGMRFGADVNAYTAFDQTVYQLLVPTDDQALMLKGLDILRDWSNDVTFDPTETEKERGVVLEEWRLGRGADSRIFDKQFPIMFQGSKYGVRLPIGVPEVLKTAPREALVRFYKDWYQPQNMAVIAVGDFDPAQLEKEIASRFGDLKATPNAKQRPAIPVPRDHGLLVTIETDKEMAYTSVQINDKIERRREETKGDYRRFLVDNLYHQMMNARFAELGEDPEAPFVWAFSSSGGWVREGDMITRGGGVKEGKALDVLSVLFRETARVEKHGFLQSELDRAIKAQLASAENSALEWEKTQASELADEMTRNFFEKEQMPGRALELQYNKELLPTITLAELNTLAKAWSGKTGRVIQVSGPAKSKMPTVEEVRAVASAVPENLTPWLDEGGDKPLMSAAPTPGKVTKTETLADDVTQWTLANGVRVFVKPTTFQNDQVMFTGYQRGGSSLVADKDFTNARFAADIVSASGVGEFDSTTLRKVLAGKQVSAYASIGELSESVGGSARATEVETALQLLHLRLTSPRLDPKAFAVWKAEQIENVRNRQDDPERMFFEQMEAVQTGNHLRYQPTTLAMIDKVDHAKAMAIYKDRFADLGDFTFVFVGNLDLAKLQPLVETYLGSLPAKGRKEKWKDVGVKYPTGKVTKTFQLGTEPKSYVEISMSSPDKWTLDAQRDATILSMVLRIKLREVLREDMGGVYGVQVWAGYAREPKPRKNFGVFFGCDPDRVEQLRAAVFDEVGKVAKSGIGDEYLGKVTETLRRTRETDKKENWWWMNQIRQAAYFGDDFKTTTDIEALLKRVSSANVKAAATKFFDTKNYVFGVMTPVKAAK